MPVHTSNSTSVFSAGISPGKKYWRQQCSQQHTHAHSVPETFSSAQKLGQQPEDRTETACGENSLSFPLRWGCYTAKCSLRHLQVKEKRSTGASIR